MPADEERQVAQGLSGLRSDVDRVAWADAESVRRRGRHRTQQQVAAGTLAVTVGIGLIGVAAGGWRPWASDPSLVANPSAGRSESVPAGERDPDTSSGKGNTSPEDRETGAEQAEPDDPSTKTTEVREPTNPLDPSPSDQADPAESPTPSPPASPTVEPTQKTVSPRPAEVSAADLLAPAEMPVLDGATQSWSEEGTRDGESSNASVCASGTLDGLGAADSVRRDYVWGGTAPTAAGVNVVAAFESAEDATAAFGSYAGWAANCAWGDELHGPTTVTVDNGTARWWWFRKAATETGAGQVEVLGLVRVGAMVSVVSWHRDSATFAPGSDPMAPVLADSAGRLQPQAGS